MKSIGHLITAVLFISPFLGISQSSGIDAALDKGNATQLGNYFAEKVDVSILEKDATVPSSAATSQIDDFFTRNAVKSYKRAHVTAASNGRSGYSLGDLSTSTGSYRVYLYFDGKQKISEIRIEK